MNELNERELARIAREMPPEPTVFLVALLTARIAGPREESKAWFIDTATNELLGPCYGTETEGYSVEVARVVEYHQTEALFLTHQAADRYVQADHRMRRLRIRPVTPTCPTQCGELAAVRDGLRELLGVQ